MRPRSGGSARAVQITVQRRFFQTTSRVPVYVQDLEHGARQSLGGPRVQPQIHGLEASK